MNETGDNQKPPQGSGSSDGRLRPFSGSTQRSGRPKRDMALGIVLGLVVLLVILFTLTPLHGMLQRPVSVAPTPTLPLLPGDDLFYIEVQPWGAVTLDGHVLTKLPDDQRQPPLRLARGIHHISWHADPFEVEQCTFSVPPPINGVGCPYESNITMPTGTPVRLITFSASLALLPPNQRAALLQKAQSALNALRSTATVQPGELYVNARSSRPFDTATQPLQATLQFALDTDLNSNHTCASQDLSGCHNGAQDCRQFCTLGGGTTPSAHNWGVLAVMYPTWTYTTASGHILIQNQPALTPVNGSDSDHSLFLYITWQNGTWNVSVPPVQAAQLGSFPPDPGCAALQNTLNESSQYRSTQQATRLPVTWQLMTGSNRASGCLGLAVLQQDSSGTPTTSHQPAAYCLDRFGVLLAANTLAHQYWPDLPLADSAEQEIALQLATTVKILE